MKKVLVFISMALLSGCASIHKKAIDTTALPALKNRPVAYVVRPMPGFIAMTPTKAFLGGSFIGTALAHSEGGRIVKENKIENPSGAIALGLATELSNQFEMKLIADPIKIYNEQMDDADISRLAKNSADFIVDVSTYSWGSGTYPLDLTRYRISYSGSARVINTATEEVIAEGYCSYTMDDEKNAPGYDELFGNGAVRFKQEMALLAMNCVKNMRADMRQNNAR